MPNQIVFVPACLLCPAYQAHSKKNTVAWACQWRSFLSENNLGVVQMPCPEASFDSVECGLGRKPHGITFYENLEGFSAYCQSLAQKTANHVLNFYQQGYHILALVGIEHSPTCAVNYMYTHSGMLKRSGIFMGELIKHLSEAGVSVPVIGINRRYPEKAIIQMKKMIG